MTFDIVAYSPTVPIFTIYQFFNEKKVQGIYDLLMILNGGSQYDSSHSRSVIENASKMQRGKNFLNNCKRPWKKYSICLLTKMLQKERVLNVQVIWWKEIEIHVFFSCLLQIKSLLNTTSIVFRERVIFNQENVHTIVKNLVILKEEFLIKVVCVFL